MEDAELKKDAIDFFKTQASYKGVNIDTTEARKRIQQIKDELDEMIVADDKEFLEGTKDELMKITDLTEDQIDNMLLTIEEVCHLEE